ncbi:MAG: DUF4382 domain-containing protein [Chloroflexota bacterium]
MARLVQIKTVNNPFRIVALALVLGFIAASAQAAAQDQGMLEIQIKDHRDAIEDFAKLDIAIEKISISPKPGLMFWQTGWKDLTPSTAITDLTKHVGKNPARVFRAPIDTGAFDAFRLKLKSITAVLKKNGRSATVKNTLGPVKLSFEVPARGETVLILDLVVTDFSDHPPRHYELGMRGYELFTNGKLVERIPPE